MDRKIMVRCLNLGGEKIAIDGGTTLLEMLDGELRARLGFTPVAARVNNKTQPLRYPVFMPKDVEFIDARCDSGRRTVVRSLCMLLYKAVADCLPGTRLRIEHSVARGHYCRLFKGAEVSAETVERLRARMHELVAADLPFERREAPTTDVIEIFRRQGLNDKVRLLKTVNHLYTVYYTLDGTADSYYGALVPSTGYLKVFDLQLYKEGFLLMGPDPENGAVAAQPKAQEKMYDAFLQSLKLNQVLRVRNVGELNLAVAAGQSADLINVAEAMHVKHIGAMAEEIARRYREGGARVVLIAGPSSSGKTTFTKRLAVQLTTCLLRPRMISLDNYFVAREQTPREADGGDYDFEHLHALDLELFNADLNRLINGEEVDMPTYNFERGERVYKGDRIRLNDDSVLLIEGIHGLNPELTAQVDDRMKYTIYVSALTTLAIDDHNWVPTTDNRLLRRIVRDYQYRGVSARETIRRWPSVRRGEERWIFPFQENADATFNSSLIFELSVIKELAERVLHDVPRDCVEYAEAWRLRRFLSYFRPIEQQAIPPTSLLREFLGGSSFHY